MLETKPLEFSDFSGGITDNILQGDIRRYEECDNLFITVDKKLEERPGIIPFSSGGYNLSGFTNQRVNGWYWLINESQPIVQAGRSLFYFDTSWHQIIGKGGNPAIEGGDNYSQTTFGEFKRQTYFATDGTLTDQGVRPSKIYRDDTNAWTAKTVGLPRARVAGNYTNATLLAYCLALANALRTSFINHMNEAALPDGTLLFSQAINAAYIHGTIDKYSLSYLVAQTFGPNAPETPSPIPTPAPAATNEATLYPLVRALSLSYAHHIADAAKGALGQGGSSITRNYHWAILVNQLDQTLMPPPSGPHAKLSNTTLPSDLETAAAQLDDLLQKWNWHRKGIWVHSQYNQSSVYNKYAPTQSAIGTVHLAETTATVTPDFLDVINFANNLKYMFNAHIADTLYPVIHTIPNNDAPSLGLGLQDYLPDATVLDDFYLQVFWLRSLYYMHYLDANVATHTQVAFTPAIGSPNLTAITRVDTGTAISIGTQKTLYAYGNGLAFAPTVNNSYGAFARTTASASGTATIDRNALIATAGTLGQVSYSVYHVARSSAGAYVTTTTSVQDATAALGNSAATLGTDVASWLALASELWNSMAAHISDLKVHTSTVSAILYSYINGVPYPNFQIPTVAQYSYAYYFSDLYTVEPSGIQFETRGNPVQSDVVTAAVSYYQDYILPNDAFMTTALGNVGLPVLTTRANVLSNLPVLVNDASTNYDTTNAKLNIYRTEDGGATYRLIAQVANGTLTYSDTVNDTIPNPGSDALETREALYTTGGVVGYDQPPECRFVHEVNGTFYYGGVFDGAQFFAQRILQSVQNIPDSAPATFSDDLEDDLVGISSARSIVVAFCRSSIYRMSGSFNELGQGALLHDKIADKVGALNAKSIVQTEIGIFFAGTDGFYYTDGYQIIKISLELDETYKSLTTSDAQKRRIYGCYDTATRRVWWAMSESPTGAENSILYGFYLNYGVKPSGTFTTISNLLNFQPASISYKNGDLYIGHGQGVLLKTYEDAKYDVQVSTTVSASLWNQLIIPYDFTSVAWDVGTTFKRKYQTRVHIVGKNEGDQAIQVYAVRDLNQTAQGPVPLAPINYQDNCIWGNPTFIWGDTSFLWRYDGKMDLWRRFPATTLRSDFMQLKLVPASLTIYASSSNYPEFANAITNSVTKTATIQTPSGYTLITWPLDIVGYSMSFAYDDYATSFQVTALDVTKTIATLSDAGNAMVSAPAGTAWQIAGAKKNQRVSITSMVVHYAMLGDENQAFPGYSTNDGAGNAGNNP